VLDKPYYTYGVDINDSKIKFKIACVLNERRLKGLRGVALDEETDESRKVAGLPRISVSEILDSYPEEAVEVLNRTLLNLSRLVSQPFNTIKLFANASSDNLHFFTKEKSECIVILNELSERGWLRDNGSSSDGFCKIITIDGWEIINKLKTTDIDSKNGFVAMWFHPDMDECYSKGIEPAVKNAGYNPVRMDTEEFNSKICDEITAEIRRCKFLVADVSGQRNGVYFEAGFAKGLGKPVIFTVRKEDKDKLHFDTRQYNHIIYKSPADLKERLYDRIRATIV